MAELPEYVGGGGRVIVEQFGQCLRAEVMIGTAPADHDLGQRVDVVLAFQRVEKSLDGGLRQILEFDLDLVRGFLPGDADTDLGFECRVGLQFEHGFASCSASPPRMNADGSRARRGARRGGRLRRRRQSGSRDDVARFSGQGDADVRRHDRGDVVGLGQTGCADVPVEQDFKAVGRGDLESGLLLGVGGLAHGDHADVRRVPDTRKGDLRSVLGGREFAHDGVPQQAVVGELLLAAAHLEARGHLDFGAQRDDGHVSGNEGSISD